MAFDGVTDHPVVGRVRWRAAAARSKAPLELLDGFEPEHLVTVVVPQLVGVADRRGSGAGRFDGRVRFFGPATGQLLAAFAALERAGLGDRLVSFAGSFCPRLKAVAGGGATRSPSNHAFGTAFDLNEAANPLGASPPAVGRPGSVRELVPLFEQHGFAWGGHFRVPDGMHFEVARLLPPERVSVPVPLRLFLGGVERAVPCLLVGDTTWVGVRALVALLGGTLVRAGERPFGVRVAHGAETVDLPGLLVGDTGYVPLRALLRMFRQEPRLDLVKQRVDIVKPT